MRKIEKLLRLLTTGIGSLALLFFVASFYVLESLRPKMINFIPISASEESLITIFGVNLLIFFAFCLLFLFQLVKHLRIAKKITRFHYVLLADVVLSLILIFGDFALISDIGKQYTHHLAQPEWQVLYMVMGFQFVSTIILTFANNFKLLTNDHPKDIAKDSNIFLIVQYVGIICGILGLLLTAINFLFPRPLWMIKAHTMMTSLFLLIPYGLVVIYWMSVKIQEKSKEFYDEKQVKDLSHSALWTLVISVPVMSLLFFSNYSYPEGITSVVWLPFYLFLTLSLFSAGNLYLTQKN